jgi:hypothetical protein
MLGGLLVIALFAGLAVLLWGPCWLFAELLDGPGQGIRIH